MTLDQYIASHIDPEPEHLYRLYRHTHIHHLYPRMCSGHIQGRVLKMLTAMISPMSILELGTYTGYSSLCIAEGMPRGAHLDTIEIDDEMADELHETFAGSDRAQDITLHIGDALDIIPQLDRCWDMIYIDANKRLYSQYLELVIDRVAPGGFIIADNTLWDNKVLEPSLSHDPQSAAIAAFNDKVAADPRLDKIILPVRDGLTIMRRRQH